MFDIVGDFCGAVDKVFLILGGDVMGSGKVEWSVAQKINYRKHIQDMEMNPGKYKGIKRPTMAEWAEKNQVVPKRR